MKPTYDITEVINLIASIETSEELERLARLLQEEKKRYSLNQIKAIAVLLDHKRTFV